MISAAKLDFRPGLLLVMAALAVVLGGCGDSTETAEEPAEPRLTKPQLVEKMGDICQEHTDKKVILRERFRKKHGLPLTGEDIPQALVEQELLQISLPEVRETIRDLEELRPPRSEEAKFEAFLDALRYGVKATQANPEKLAVPRWPEPFTKARERAGDLEAYYCGQA